ncbi:MAG: hypothetical protein ABI700_00995 [Chloroflexota bacterium]
MNPQKRFQVGIIGDFQHDDPSFTEWDDALKDAQTKADDPTRVECIAVGIWDADSALLAICYHTVYAPQTPI